MTRIRTALVLVLASASALVVAQGPAASAGDRPGVPVRVGTYNVCGQGCLPTKAECVRVIGRDCATKLRPWADGRAEAVAADVAGQRIGVVATQEIGNNATPTQQGVDVESFRAPLTAAMRARGYAQAPADYAGARHPWFGYPLRSGAGRFTYYDARRYSHLDARGRALPHALFWLPDSSEVYGKTMTWNVLRERRTGRRFVVVDMHLEYRKNGASDPNGWTKNWDQVRYGDARRTALEVASHQRATRGLPVVFAGDMNSESTAQGASATDAFADEGFVDAHAVARHRRGDRWASFNGGVVPLPTGEKIDHLYVSPATTVRRWVQVPQTTAGTGDPADLLRSDHNLSWADLVLRPARR